MLLPYSVRNARGMSVAVKPALGRPRRFGSVVGCANCPAVLTLRALAQNSLRALTGDALLGARVATWQAYVDSAVAVLATFHAGNPDAPGLGLERLGLSLTPRLPQPAFARVVAQMVGEARVVIDRSWVRLPGLGWEVVAAHVSVTEASPAY